MLTSENIRIGSVQAEKCPDKEMFRLGNLFSGKSRWENVVTGKCPDRCSGGEGRVAGPARQRALALVDVQVSLGSNLT